MDKQCYFYVMDVDVLENEDIFKRTYDLVPADRREKVDSFIPRKSKNLSLGAGYLLEYAGKDLMTGHDRMVSVEDQSAVAPLYYSLSHSGSRALCAVSDVRIGCDVETIREERAASLREINVAERFFTPNECITIRKDSEAFYRFWTLKESFLKVTGYGLSMPLDCFEIELGSELRLISRGDWLGDHGLDTGDYRLYEPMAEPDYRYALCIRSREEYRLRVEKVEI